VETIVSFSNQQRALVLWQARLQTAKACTFLLCFCA
jgi:hypothetical protein